jgi:hypothetical protein
VYRNNAKKDFEEHQYYLDQELHQEPDHSSNFMKMFREEHMQCQLSMKKYDRLYHLESFGTEPYIVFKYLGTMLKVIT